MFKHTSSACASSASIKAKPEHNGAVGRATMFDREAQRYAVELEGGGATLKVKEANLELAAPEAGLAV